MNNDEMDQNKSEKPHAHFVSAHDVVVDPVLSKDQVTAQVFQRG